MERQFTWARSRECHHLCWVICSSRLKDVQSIHSQLASCLKPTPAVAIGMLDGQRSMGSIVRLLGDDMQSELWRLLIGPYCNVDTCAFSPDRTSFTLVASYWRTPVTACVVNIDVETGRLRWGHWLSSADSVWLVRPSSQSYPHMDSLAYTKNGAHVCVVHNFGAISLRVSDGHVASRSVVRQGSQQGMVIIAPDGHTSYVRCALGTGAMIDTSTGRELWAHHQSLALSFPGPHVHGCVFSPSGEQLLLSVYDSERDWQGCASYDSSTGQLLWESQEGADTGHVVAYYRDGASLVVANLIDYYLKVQMLDAADGTPIWHTKEIVEEMVLLCPPRYDIVIGAILCSPCEPTVFVECCLTVWSLDAQVGHKNWASTLTSPRSTAGGSVSCSLACSPTGARLAVCLRSGGLHILCTHTGQCLMRVSENVTSVAWARPQPSGELQNRHAFGVVQEIHHTEHAAVRDPDMLTM